MNLIIIVENNSSLFYQTVELKNNQINFTNNLKNITSENFSDYISISLFNYENSLKNFNLLELSQCSNLGSLRYKLFKKRYISSKISTQIEIIRNCCNEMLNQQIISLSEKDVLEEDVLEEDVLEEKVSEKNTQTDQYKKLKSKHTQTDNKKNSYDLTTCFIFYSLGLISGYILHLRPFKTPTVSR